MHVFESVKPRCLCVSVSVSTILFMSNGGCCGGFAFREKINNFLPVLKATNHASAQVLIVFRSMFSECAAPLGDSTIMYKLVSSANNQIEQPRFWTMSFIKIRKSNGPRIKP